MNENLCWICGVTELTHDQFGKENHPFTLNRLKVKLKAQAALVRQMLEMFYFIDNDLKDLKENHPQKELLISRSLRYSQKAIAAAEKFLSEPK